MNSEDSDCADKQISLNFCCSHKDLHRWINQWTAKFTSVEMHFGTSYFKGLKGKCYTFKCCNFVNIFAFLFEKDLL